MNDFHGKDGRRPPFLWCELAAVAYLRRIADGPELVKLRSVYFAIAELAAVAMDGEHGGFSATKDELVAAAGISDRRIKPYLDRLVACGLLVFEECSDSFGRSLPNRYKLVDAPAESMGGDALSPPPPTPRHGHPRRGGVETSPPSRARPDAVKKEEEREREGARANADHRGEVAIEPVVVAVLAPLLTQRGEIMGAGDRLAIRKVIEAPPDGVDVEAAATRLAKNYGPDGKAANRRIGSIAAVLAAEIANSTPTVDRVDRFAGRRSSTARRASLGSPKVPAGPPTHDGLPAGLERPYPKLEQQWQEIREELRRAVSEASWGEWLTRLELAGHLTALTTDGDDERPEQVIVLSGPPDVLSWAVGRFNRAIEAVAQFVLGPDVRVEYTTARPAPAAAASEEAA